MKNFRTSARISCFSISRLVVVYTSRFLDFSYPPPLFCSRDTNFARTRNEFALGPAAELLSLRNTLSSGMSCEKLLPVIHFFRAHYTNLCAASFPLLIFGVSRKGTTGITKMLDRTRILSTFRCVSSPAVPLAEIMRGGNLARRRGREARQMKERKTREKLRSGSETCRRSLFLVHV